MTNVPVLSARELTRIYSGAAGDVIGCQAVTVDVLAGELVVLRGRSGAGKTTLLNLLGGLDRPTSGSMQIGGLDIASMPETELAALRRDRLGFVFQSFALLPMLSAAENIEVPLRIQRVAPAERDARVAEALDAVGLSRHGRQRPGELSGGQQQRVGLARALVGRPDILIADEPTAQLDSVTAATIMDLISEMVHAGGIAAVVATHHAAMAARATRVWEIRSGRVTEQSAAAGSHGRRAAP
ncbi:putative ABC transport system ATP-binding protein [Nakamurella sp. UYEF19]|uniref:ABC transporter ATP-binding protein n=1 Tax=Nakamurella sp. UYEF19 TaxID=1756392 RepID=UPI0033952B46